MQDLSCEQAALGAGPGPAWLPALTDDDVAVWLDARGRATSCTSTMTSVLGYHPDDVLGRSPSDLPDPVDAAAMASVLERLGRTGRIRTTVRLHHRAGHPVWLDLAGKAVRLGTGPAAGTAFCITARDVTDEARALEALSEAEQLWRLAFESSPIGAALITRDGALELVNDALATMLGYRADDLGRLHAEVLTLPEEREREAARCAQMFAGALEHHAGERRLQHADGQTLWCHVNLSAVPGHSGTVRSLLLQVQDISQRRQLELELANRALHDELTELPNRFLAGQWLGSALDEQSGRDVGVLYCDLDRFKVVNDGLGHAAGDELLVEVAARLTAAVRPDDMVCRMGGDEFVVICEGVEGAAELAAVAQRVLACLDEPVLLGEHTHATTISVGAALGRMPDTAEDVLLRADMALLRAKRVGRARVELFDPTLDHAHTSTDLDFENDLRRSVGDGELRAYYQPVVALPSGTVIGYEALMRWQHPERGLLAPGEFLPLAESSGLVRPLGAWILSTACRDAAGPAGMLPPGGWVAVNASPTQLNRASIVTLVTDALTTSGLAPSQLHLEITETAVLAAGPGLLGELEELDRLGVAVVLDDFGTGYSSLRLLHELPVSAVKLDRSFIAPLPGDARALAIVRAVLAMCRDLGLPTIAEGVETLQQADLLTALGCTHAQGFVFGHPQPHPEPQPQPIDRRGSRNR